MSITLILNCRVFDVQRKIAHQARQDLRSAAQGTGDRADKVRTYNFPQVRDSVLCYNLRLKLIASRFLVTIIDRLIFVPLLR
jgi:protein subunit release factor A